MATATVTLKFTPSELQTLDQALRIYARLCKNVYYKQEDKLEGIVLRVEDVQSAGSNVQEIIRGIGMTP